MKSANQNDTFSPADLLSIAHRSTPAAMASFLTREDPPEMRFQWPKHIDFISMKIAQAVAGSCPRVIVNMPPQHGKSTLISKWAPTWFLENWPNRRVLLGSYSGEFAEKWGRHTRDALEQYQSKLRVRVSPSTSAAGEWETVMGGGMVAVGVGGSATGRGADLEIIDDPHKDAKEANSNLMRQNVWEWFTSVMLTRLSPKAPLFIIHTRWHPDDLTGRIKRKMQEDPDFPRFEVINLPALAEGDDPLDRKPGDALWPERYTAEWLKSQRKLIGSYFWNALYQGRPTALEGGYFKGAWFDSVEPYSVPLKATTCRFWDLAATAQTGGNDPDWTVGVKMSLSSAGVIFVTDMIRVRESAARVEQRIRTTAKMDGPACRIRMQQDPGQAGKQQIAHFQRNILPGYDFRGVLSNSDKVTRSGPYNAASERGDVKLVRSAWNEQFIEEHREFPGGLHDDIVDAAAGAYTDLMGVSQAWGADAIRSAFSYGDKGKSNVMQRLGFRTEQAAYAEN